MEKDNSDYETSHLDVDEVVSRPGHEVTRDYIPPDRPITYLLYSGFNLDIEDSLGRPEYSYHFVLNGFRSALSEIGPTIVVSSLSDVDAALDTQEAMGARCVLLCFMSPHRAPVGMRCPTLCVFTWEFGNLPNEMFEQDPRSDWRTVFAQHGRAITLSEHAAHLVREAMGADFPVTVIAVPLPERLMHLGWRDGARRSSTIAVRGSVYDSRAYGPYLERPVWTPPVVQPPQPPEPPQPAPVVAAAAEPSRIRVSIGVSRYYALMWYRDGVRTLLPRPVTQMVSRVGRGYYRVRLILRPPAPRPPDPAMPVEPEPPTVTMEAVPEAIRPVEHVQRIRLDGVVYTAVFNPADSRKNWHDMLTAFCWAFRDNPDVTLVMKMVHHDRFAFEGALATLIEKLQPFRCRIITLQVWLDDDEYDALISATDYYVNTSSCEGLCLPLMEFMSAGRPAIAPDHTAMADYVDDRNAFVLRYGVECDVWPNDPRDLFRTMRHRLEWASLLEAYRASYRVRIDDPARYAEMSKAARRATRSICSLPIVKAKLGQAIGKVA